MLYPTDLSRLRWHPAMRRVENYAIFTERRGGQPARNLDMEFRRCDEGRSDFVRDLLPAQRRDHVLKYLMACGHESLPNRAVCERGCLTAPEWGSAFRGTKAKPRGVS